MRLLTSLIAAILTTSWAILGARWISGIWGPIDLPLAAMWTITTVAITLVLWRRP